MISHKPSKKTFLWVSGAHVLVLLLALFFAHVLVLTPAPPKLLMVNLGQEENTNPAEGQVSVRQRGAENTISQPAAPPAAPQPVVPSPPPQPVPPQPVTPPEPTPPVPVKNDFPAEPAPVKPKPAKPKPAQVKVDLSNPVTRSSTNKPTAAKTPGQGSAINANQVERSLSNALGGDPSAGVPGGTGDQGSPGSRTGNPNGDWYRTLIKNTLERHWMKPQADNPNLTTTIKIRILADGTIQYLGMTSGSGDTAMDNSVISAVRAAGKMAVPPPAGFPKPYEDTVIFRLKGDL
jgi:TonB family protein